MKRLLLIVAAIMLANISLIGVYENRAVSVMEEIMNEDLICRPEWMVQTHADLKRHEGFRPYPYPDPLSPLGKKHGRKFGYKPARQVLQSLGASEKDGAPWTIGYGFAVGITPDTPAVTEEQAAEKLWEKIPQYSAKLDRLVPNWYDMPVHVITVLVNMMFNMGEGGLSKFKNTLKLFNEGKYEAAGNNLTKSLWYKQVGGRAVELTNRLKSGAIDARHRVIS